MRVNMAVMNKMRESMKIILMILVFAFIATIIFDWGMGGFRGKRRPQGIIAQVNGEDISYEEFSKAYQQELKSHREQTGQDVEGYQLQQVENQVFERLIQQRLLRKVVDKMNLTATDDEIGEELWNNPPDIVRQSKAFQDSSTGVFNMERYQAALEDPQLDQQWENVGVYLRSSLPFQKLGNLINASAIVTDDDARIEYMKNNMKAKVNYILFDASAFAGKESEPAENEIKAYYENHQKDFFEKEQRVLDYVLFELKASQADSQAVMRNAEELTADARAGRNFAEMAGSNSQDPGSAEKGGDLGYFKRSAMVKPFADAAFGAKVGDIVGPVASQFGLHIIKVEGKQIVDGEEEVKASHILLKIEPSNKTRDALRDNATYIAETAKESNLKSVADAEKVAVQTTQPFAADGFIPGLGMESRVSRFAFRSQIGDVSDVLNTENGYLVAELKKIDKEHTASLETARPRIISALKTEQRMNMAKAAAQAAEAALAAGSHFDQAAQQQGLSVQMTEEFVLGRSIPGVGREPAFAATAISLGVGEVSQPVLGTRGYYLIQLVEKNQFNESDFQQQKDALKAQLAVRQRNQMFSQWYTKIKSEAKIKDYRGDFL
jgi:peptidyl-prolyl cis-trans isomerase D